MTTFNFGNWPVPAHQHKNGGGWVANTAKVADHVYVGPDARIAGGTFCGGDFFGGWFYDGEYRGGTFYGGWFYDGLFRGGTFHDGTFRGGDFRGGDFHGGGYFSGRFDSSPLQIQIGRWLAVSYADYVRIGCEEIYLDHDINRQLRALMREYLPTDDELAIGHAVLPLLIDFARSTDVGRVDVKKGGE